MGRISDFYIDRLIVSGKNVETFEYEFSDNNIICGGSDSGKTMMLNVIVYVFGKSMEDDKDEELIILRKNGYDTFSLIMKSRDNKTCRITRVYGESSVTVENDDGWVEPGKYKVAHNVKSRRLNDLLLSMIGIKNVPRLPSDQAASPATMTWANLCRLLYLDEDRVGSKDELIEFKKYTEKTLLLSVLLYLIYGVNFAEKELEKKDTSKIKHDAKIEYIAAKAEQLRRLQESKKQSLFETVGFDDCLEEKMNGYEEELQELDKAIKDANERCRQVYSDINICEQELQKKIQLKQTYVELESQYKSDLKRLNNIVEGTDALEGVPTLDNCPFCNGRIAAHSHRISTETAKNEFLKTTALLQGLIEAEIDLDTEIKDLEIKSKNLGLNRDCLQVELEIQRKNTDEIKAVLNTYKEYCRLKSESEYIEALLKEFESDEEIINGKYQQDLEELKNFKYIPKEHFEEHFIDSMTRIAQEVSKGCNYWNYDNIYFSRDKFDLMEDGYKKSSIHGKGMTTVFNSMLFLTLSLFLTREGTYKPGFLIIDSPFIGFTQKDSESYTEEERERIKDIKEGFVRYVSKWSGGQIFVACSSEDITPSVWRDISSSIIDLNAMGRSGFIPNYVLKKMPKK